MNNTHHSNERQDKYLPILINKFLHDARNKNGTAYTMLEMEEFDAGYLYKTNSEGLPNWKSMLSDIHALNDLFDRLGKLINDRHSIPEPQKSEQDLYRFLSEKFETQLGVTNHLENAFIQTDWTILESALNAVLKVLSQHSKQPFQAELKETKEAILIQILVPKLNLTSQELKLKLNPFAENRSWDQSLGLSFLSGRMGLYLDFIKPDATETSAKGIEIGVYK